MTKFLQNRPPTPPPEEQNWIERLLEKIKHPSKKVTIIGISGLVLGVGGYLGLQVLVKEKLPPFLEVVIGNFIARPIDLGEVQSFSLTGIELGKTEIPATATDPDYVTVEEVKVGFNILPVIFRRTLPLDVTLVQPKVYAEQEQDGEWLNLDSWQSDEESKEPPIYFDVSVDVEEGDITAVPYNQSPIQVSIDGNGRYNPANNTQIEYDLEAAIAKAKATIQGETVVETGKTDTKLLIQDLALADVATLLPNSPLNLSSGKLNANLDINIPSFEEINSTNVEGSLSLQELSGSVKDLSAPIKARAQLNFGGKEAQVEQTQASIGDIVAQLSGTVNWQEGYDLAVDVLPFRLSSLSKILPSELPVDTAGEVTAKLEVTGDIQEPVVKGKINNTETLRVAKTQFKQIQANFTADLNKFILDNLHITPLAGGKITAEGTIATNLKGSLESDRPIDVVKMPMALKYNVELPTEEIVAPYYQFPSEVAVGNLQAAGEIRGTISNPEASIDWQITQAGTSSVDNISGEGEIFLVNKNLLLQDTEIEVGEGSINIEGNSDIEGQTWQTDITANSIALTPFLSQLQLEGVNLHRPISIDSANAKFQGKLNALDLNKIQGVANVQLDVDGGDVAVNSQLNQGTIQANATSRDISVGKFVPNLPIPTTLRAARIDVAGRLQQLLSVSENPNLSSVDANLNANLIMADGTVKAKGKLNNNQWQTEIRAANLNTNYLLDTFASNNQSLNLDNLNAQVDLTGSINPLLNQETNFPINVNKFALQTGNQSLDANGNLLISDLTTNPDVASAEGRKQGDLFSLDIVNFPLALINLTPGKPLGIEGALQGKVTGEVAANLYSLATNGDITVDRPGIGYIKADGFNAKFNYDPNQNIAEVATGSLDLKDSQYNFQGGLNLQSGELDGKLNISQAYIQDILTTFRWFTFADLTRLFQTPDYAEPVAVDPNSVITVNESITQKLNLLRDIENRIQALAESKKAGNIPTLLDIEGGYQGEITLDGTINNPEVNFQVKGNNWQWHTQPGFVDIVKGIKPLGFFGLVKKESPKIALDKILVQGQFQGETVNLGTATIQVEDAILSLDGQLSTNQQNANYQVQNLTVNTIEKFTNIPIALTGVINTAGTITGTLSKPNIEGQINFTDGSFNGQNLPLTIAGKYDYTDYLFTFKTTEPSYIQIDASIPYPVQPDISDRVYADVKLTTEAFALLDVFTSKNLTWVDGEGTANLRGVGKIDLEREQILYGLDAQGEVNLDKATVKSAYFESPLVATGKITINNQVVTVETLEGKFAEKDLSVTGSLPILYAVDNLDNHLTINLPPGKIDIEELYKGKVAGDVVITSAALSPVISGEVNLENGQVFLPEKKSNNASTEDAVVENIQQASNQEPTIEEPPSAIIKLQDFQVNLDELRFQQSPLYEFEAAGDLTLNGRVDDIPNLQADGTIQLTEGYINLLSNNFSLVRRHQNLIVFNPEAGILNPYLDIQLKTEVSNFQEFGVSSRQLSQGRNEIPAPITTAGNTNIIRINLDIDGEAQEILPSLGKDPSDYCPVRPDNARLKGKAGYTQAQLDQLAKCIEVAALNDGSERQFINSPAVELTSNPARNRGEILGLLGNSLIDFAKELQNKNTEELLELGVTQFVIAPIQRRLFNRFEDGVVSVGRKIGLDYLRIYPLVEGIYEINQDSSIRGTFNYINNLTSNEVNNSEFKVEYQLRF
ncbi:MAG: translocation/assembly module TamB domain-containing protein [Xenococcaceae cyanobacterium MO_188.B32]|nr:translocation/assembly module TamB domain-containing protein [Xenococcaceae cyanobacterium MO_188.B32]